MERTPESKFLTLWEWVPESLFDRRRYQFSPCEFWILSWMMAQLHPLVWVARVPYMKVRYVGLIPPRSIQKLKLGFLHPGCVPQSHVYDDAYLSLLFKSLRNALFLSKQPLQPIIQNFLTFILLWNPEKSHSPQMNLWLLLTSWIQQYRLFRYIYWLLKPNHNTRGTRAFKSTS